VGQWSLAAFVDNLTNSHAFTDFNNSVCAEPGLVNGCAAGPQGSRLLREYSFRPRTFGITAIFRQ